MNSAWWLTLFVAANRKWLNRLLQQAKTDRNGTSANSKPESDEMEAPS